MKQSKKNLKRQGVARLQRVSHGILQRCRLLWLTDCHQVLAYYAKLASSSELLNVRTS